MARRRKVPFPVPDRLGVCSGLRPIGAGAMGAVFVGNHDGMGIQVAVKVLNPKLGRSQPTTLKRFVREVRLLAGISSQHIVRIYDAGQEGKYTYMIMELVKGQSLDMILAAEPDGRMRDTAVAYYLREVALGLAAVHKCGIVHRDVKPDNVMVDTYGQTKITDFGLARGEDSVQLTLSDEVVGTPEYMCPEIIAHEDVDGRADLYSLGIMAYQLLSGSTPFNKGNLLKIVQDHLRKPVPPLQERVPSCNPDLVAIVHRLLEKKRDDRYPDAQALANILKPLADTSPPHRPQAASNRLPAETAAASGPVRVPGWDELSMIRLLIHYGIYEEGTLLQGLTAWRKLVVPIPVGNYLVNHGGLPADTATQAMSAARQSLANLRDRIGFGLLKRSGVLSGDQLAGVARDPLPAGVSLSASLVQRGILTEQDARSFELRIDGSLDQALQRVVVGACQRFNVPPAPLGQLEGRLPSTQYDEVYKAAIASLVQQMG